MDITIIGGSSGAVSSLILHKMQWGWWDIGATNNGILSGLVSITAGCATMEPEGAFITGTLGGVIYFFSSNLLLRLQVSILSVLFSPLLRDDYAEVVILGTFLHALGSKCFRVRNGGPW